MGYKFRVEFTKIFTSGTLKGLSHSDSVGYQSFGAAENWINSVRYLVEKGEKDFILDSARIVEGRKVVHQWFR